MLDGGGQGVGEVAQHGFYSTAGVERVEVEWGGVLPVLVDVENWLATVRADLQVIGHGTSPSVKAPVHDGDRTEPRARAIARPFR